MKIKTLPRRFMLSLIIAVLVSSLSILTKAQPSMQSSRATTNSGSDPNKAVKKTVSVKETNSPAQPSKEEKILLQAGAKKLDDWGTKFDLDGDKLALTRDKSDLAAIQVEFKKRASVIKYEEIVQLADRLKPLGYKKPGGEFGIVGPAGYVTRNYQYSQAYIVRKEHTCSEDEEYRCGIINFTISYWLPLKGIITNKRIEEVNDENAIFRKIRYFITVNDAELEVSETDFNGLIPGQSVALEKAFGTNIARIDLNSFTLPKENNFR